MRQYPYDAQRYLIEKLGSEKASVDDQIKYATELILAIDTYAANRQFWVIEQIFKELHKQLDNKVLPTEAMWLLIQNLPLSADNVFNLISNDNDPEFDVGLIDNLFRFHNYTHEDARLEVSLCDLIRNDRHANALLILNRLLDVAPEWEDWSEPMRHAMSECFLHNEQTPVMQWFLDNEEKMVELDWLDNLGWDRRFNVSLNMYDRGMKTLGLKSLDRTIGFSEGFEYLDYEKIVGKEKAIANHHALGKYQRLCYVLATDQDITSIIDAQYEYRSLTEILQKAQKLDIPLIPERVSQFAGRAAGFTELDAKKFSDLERSLNRLNFSMTPQDVDEAFQLIAWRSRAWPLQFAETVIAASNRNVAINPEISEKWPAPSTLMLDGDWDEIEVMINAERSGSPMPRHVITQLVDKRYPGWSKSMKQQACQRAPSWMLEESEVLAVEKLEFELGV